MEIQSTPSQLLVLLNLKKLEKIKTEELLEGGEGKTVDLSDKPPLEQDEEGVNKGKGLKPLNSKKLLSRLPVLLQW